MNVAELELGLSELVAEPFDASEFVYRFLEIYKAPAASISKLRNGRDNKADIEGDLLWRAKLYFSLSDQGKAAERLDSLIEDKLTAKNKPRIIFTTDGLAYSAYDAKACEYRHGELSELNDAFDFFFPLAGIDKYQAVEENPADIKAAGSLAKLHDAILAENPDWAAGEMRHQLNIFMTRILFCMFAEDTGIFKENVFTKLIKEFGDQSERNIPGVLEKTFLAMNTPEGERDGLPKWACDFPYVNGGLFEETISIPKFSKRATRVLKEAAQLDWKEINPDIFGSMIQAVVDTEMRGDLGMHYTSVPNIMKVLHPLFLMELEEEFADALGRAQEKSRLQKLLDRISKIRVFDPACGSGNFLIIAYRELRKLEMRIYQRQDELNKGQYESRFESIVSLHNFYGIEFADFAAETAKLSLWIVEYQMNNLFMSAFGQAPPALPLNTGGNICHGNALRVNWSDVCPINQSYETYIAGNPPFYGAREQNKEQKEDLRISMSEYDGVNSIDYVCGWFNKASAYISECPSVAAFVATSSICQGQSPSLFWQTLLKRNVSICFAHRPFKWKNNAKKNAAVSCVIVGVNSKISRQKYIFDEDTIKAVENISPYLTANPDVFVTKKRTPPKGLPDLVSGNQAIDGGFLILNKNEKDQVLAKDGRAAKYFRPVYNADDFVKNTPRYCIWVSEDNLQEASTIEAFSQRFKQVQEYREGAGEVARSLVDIPYRFRYVHEAQDCLVIIPRTTTERRDYIPIGLLNAPAIVTDAIQVIYDPEIYCFSVLSSRLHMTWINAVAGRFKTDPRYSNTLVYNNFPIPKLSEKHASQLSEHAWNIIAARNAHPGKTIAWLYDPNTMPVDLLAAHQALDDTLEKIYIGRPFKNDTERLEHLFKLYSEMVSKEAK